MAIPLVHSSLSSSAPSLAPSVPSATDSQISSVALRGLLGDKTLSDPLKAINNLQPSFQPSESLKERLSQVCIQSKYDGSALSFLTIVATKIKNVAADILKWILAGSKTAALYEKAANTTSQTVDSRETLGAYTIKYTSIDEHNFGGECRPYLRLIRINSNSPPRDVYSTAVFELINATNAPTFAQAEANLKLGKLQIDDFAKEFERIEFEGTKRHFDIMGPGSEYAGHADLDFDTYWEKKKSSAHTEQYREGARNILRGAIKNDMRGLKMAQDYIELVDKLDDTKLYNCNKTLNELDNGPARNFLEKFLRSNPPLETPISKQALGFAQLDEDLKLGKVGIDDYAEGKLRIEYEGLDFDAYYEKMESNGHIDDYIKEAKKILRDAIEDVMSELGIPKDCVETLNELNGTELYECIKDLNTCVDDNARKDVLEECLCLDL